MEDTFSMNQGLGDTFRMIQAHYMYCTLYFYYYYISSISDHQALDPGGWGPLLQTMFSVSSHGPSLTTYQANCDMTPSSYEGAGGKTEISDGSVCVCLVASVMSNSLWTREQ